MGNILWFRDIKKEDISSVGGKGSNLGEMFNADIPIPQGFCVTVDAYKQFLDETGIDIEIYSILKNLNVEDTAALHDAAEKIQELILNAKMPGSIKNDIIQAYDNMNVNIDIFKSANKNALAMIKAGRDLPFVAVRSSATAEDLPSISENEFVFVKLNNKPFFGKIKELAEIVKNNDEILVPAMDNFEVKWKKISNLYRHKVNSKNLFRIKTSTGREITISPNHTLIILDEETLKPKFVEIADLKGNEKVPVVRRLETFGKIDTIDVLDFITKEEVIEENGKLLIKNNSYNWRIQQSLPRMIPLDKDFAYFLGIFTAEGTTYGNNNIIITNSNLEVINRVKAFFNSIGIRCENKLNKHSLRVYCKTLVRLLNENCSKSNLAIKGKGRTCGTKEVPSFIFSGSEEIIGEYLKGCFDGDGTISKKGVVSYSSMSERLIVGISTLMQFLDIECYLGRNDHYLISLPSNELENFNKKIGFNHTWKRERLFNILKNNPKRHSSKNSIKISKLIAEKIRIIINNELPKSLVEVCLCPDCNNIINKNSKYKGSVLYYCSNCRKSIYGCDVIKQKIEKYVDRDKEGRFLKNITPWNKSINTYPKYNAKYLKEILNQDGTIQIAEALSESIIWDEIISVEPVDYNSWVYDFTVPEIENFASGFGGIITHNSASFAGQNETFLNVRGNENLIKSVQKCWASLFGARSIYYRVENKFPHEKVFISVVVQKMVRADKAGVIFTANPATNNTEEIIIEAGYGLGEAVVSGSINPDNYVIDKNTFEIKNKKISRQDFMIVLDTNLSRNVKRTLEDDEATRQKLNDAEIIKLAKLAKMVESHYEGKPQDLEFAIEGPRIFIVQTRAITTLKPMEVKEEVKETTHGELLISGLGASPGVGAGKVILIHKNEDLERLQYGDVLVTKMTNPDMVVSMKKASAIVTDEGGVTCHAAIISRELGIPCVVGTEKATQILKDNEEITVDGKAGKVYRGKILIEQPKVVIESEINEPLETVTEVKVIVDMPELAEKAAATGADGVGLLRVEFLILSMPEHPFYMITQGKKEEFVTKLADGLRIIASAFKGKPVWYRTMDAPTDEFRKMKGGETEPEEDNPMMGWRSIRRDLDQPEMLIAQFEAIKKLHEEGLTNIGVMLPLVTHVEQVKKAKEYLRQVGLEPLEEIEFGIMIETPAAVQIIKELCEEGLDFVSFGTNDLTQFTLAVDRNNGRIQKLYDEMHPAVLRQIKSVIKVCKEYGVETSVCGQSASRMDMVEWLVKAGIDSISPNSDAVKEARKLVAKTEKKLLLGAARQKLNE